MDLLRPALVFLALLVVAIAAPAADLDKKQLQQLQLEDKLKSLQQQVSQLQNELKLSEGEPAPARFGPQIAGNPSKTDAAVAGAIKAEVAPLKTDTDSRDVDPAASFVEGGMAEQPAFLPQPERRQIGWQPMRKRLVSWQPMKKAVGWQPFKRDEEGATFRLAMNTENDLRDEMLLAVERHLVEDLSAAQKYGIEPQQILADLRERNAGRKQQRTWVADE